MKSRVPDPLRYWESSMIRFTPDQREALWAVSSDDIASIDQVVRQIRQANPQAFHTRKTLSERTFFHSPGYGVPCKGFVSMVLDPLQAREQRERLRKRRTAAV